MSNPTQFIECTNQIKTFSFLENKGHDSNTYRNSQQLFTCYFDFDCFDPKFKNKNNNNKYRNTVRFNIKQILWLMVVTVAVEHVVVSGQ